MRAASIPAALVLAGSLLLAACAPGSPPAVVDQPEVPVRSWLPETPPKAVILALHGFNDYSNAFTTFGDHAAEQGYAVFAYDQRGFGANGDAGYWPGIDQLVADLRQQRALLAERYPEVPLYLLGESMGAAVVIAAASQEEPLGVDGIILSAPAVWGLDQLNPFYRATLWVAVHLAPNLRLTGEGLDILPSDNIEMLRELGADPLVIKGTRVRAIAGLVGLMDLALSASPALPGPLLVLGGVQDQIVPPDAHKAMLAQLTAEPCTEVTYPEGYHMLLRDLQRRVVWEDVLAWIEDRPLPSGLAQACGVDVMQAGAGPG
jgi:acylglycerol lipase